MDSDYEDLLAVVKHAQADLSAMPEIVGPVEPGFMDKAADWLIDKFVPEVWEGIEHEVSLGASELAKALLGKEDPFVLYGPSLEPIETFDLSYDQMLNEAMQAQAQDQDMELER